MPDQPLRPPDIDPRRQFADRYAKGVRKRVDAATWTWFGDANAGPSTLAAAVRDHARAASKLTAVELRLPGDLPDTRSELFALDCEVRLHAYRPIFVKTLTSSGLLQRIPFPLNESTRIWVMNKKADLSELMNTALTDANAEPSDDERQRIADEIANSFLDEFMEKVTAQLASKRGLVKRAESSAFFHSILRDMAERPQPPSAAAVRAWGEQFRELERAQLFVDIHVDAWRVAAENAQTERDDIDRSAADLFFGDTPARDMTIVALQGAEQRVFAALGWQSILRGGETVLG